MHRRALLALTGSALASGCVSFANRSTESPDGTDSGNGAGAGSSPTGTAEGTASPTQSPTDSPAGGGSPTEATESPTENDQPTESATATDSPTPTESETASDTPTESATESPTSSPTESPTASPTDTATGTAAPTEGTTASPSPSATPGGYPSHRGTHRITADENYWAFTFQVDQRATLKYLAQNRRTSRFDFDVLLFTQAEFQKYKDAVNGGSARPSWHQAASRQEVKNRVVVETTLQPGTYYLVVDNSKVGRARDIGPERTREVHVEVQVTPA